MKQKIITLLKFHQVLLVHSFFPRLEVSNLLIVSCDETGINCYVGMKTDKSFLSYEILSDMVLEKIYNELKIQLEREASKHPQKTSNFFG